jgi:nicotinamidase-related amidase
MTCEPRSDRFSTPFPLATLVLVDMRRENLSSTHGFRRSVAAGVLSNCRAALAFARRMEWPVAFVSGSGDAADPCQSSALIKGFEPQRLDALFDRRSVSCYSGPYFEEGIQQSGGAAVLAGFLGRGGCLSTGADALLAGHRVTFLSDATMDDLSDRAFNASVVHLLRAFTNFDVRVLSTSAWIRSVEEFPISIEEQAQSGSAPG